MTIKQILKKNIALQIVLEKTIEKRNEQFESKSEKWQDSEKGEEFNEITFMLENNLCNIIETIDILSCYVK